MGNFITNPFWSKAVESLTYKEIVEHFAEPYDYESYCLPNHQVLLGWPGSGKSMILRSLSAPVLSKRKGERNLPFLGVYVPLVPYQIDPLILAGRNTETHELFEGYFTSYVLAKLLTTIKDLTGGVDEQILRVIIDNVDQLSFKLKIGFKTETIESENVINRLEQVYRDIADWVVENQTLDAELYGQPILKIEKLLSIIEQIHSTIVKTERLSGPICLLIDGYDYLKEFSPLVNILISKEILSFLCVKLGAVKVGNLIRKDRNGRQLKHGRDYDVLVIDSVPDDPHYYKFIQLLANKRLQGLSNQLGKELEITAFLPDDAPKSLSEMPISSRLRTLKRERKKEAYFGFDAFVKLSSGNVKKFLDLCEKAFELTVSKAVDSSQITPTPAKITWKQQADAIYTMSQRFYRTEIHTRCEDFALAIQGLVTHFCKDLVNKFAEDESFEGMGIDIEDPQNLDPIARQAIREAIQGMVFQCSKEDRVSVELPGNYIPQKIALNRLLTPKYGLSYNLGETYPITADYINKKLYEPVTDQPDYPIKTRPKKREDEAPRFWGKKAFLSSPMVEIDRPDRNKRLIRVIFELINAKLPQERLPRQRSDIIQDVYELAKRGDFRDEIYEVIKNASFTLHDVTTFRPGVAFEVGLSIGYKKPFFLLWDESERPFNAKEVPELIRGQDVRHMNFGDRGFKAWIEKRVISPAIDFQGNILCPKQWDKTCKFQAELKQSLDAAYFRCQARNEYLNKLVIKLLKENYKLRQIEPSDLPGEDELCDACYAVQKAKVCFIDATGNALEFTILLGLSKASRRPTLPFYNLALTEEFLPIWTGPKCGWTPSTLEDDIRKGISDFMNQVRRRGTL